MIIFYLNVRVAPAVTVYPLKGYIVVTTAAELSVIIFENIIGPMDRLTSIFLKIPNLVYYNVLNALIFFKNIYQMKLLCELPHKL